MIIELAYLLALLAIVLGGYGAGAYRHGWPSPVPSKHQLALRRIATLEQELGINQPETMQQTAQRIVKVANERTLIMRNPYQLSQAAYAYRNKVYAATLPPADRPNVAELKAEHNWNENQQNPAGSDA